MFTVIVATAAALLSIVAAERGRAWDPSCYAGNRCDALTFRVAGRLLERGVSPYDAAARQAAAAELGSPPPFDLPFQYPPQALPLFGAANRLWRSDAGELAWAAATAVAFVFAAAALLSAAPPGAGQALALIAVSLSGVLTFNALLGQTGAFVGALVVAAAWLWRRCPLVSGLLLGVAAVKPQYVLPLVIVALAARAWRVVAGCAIACALLAAASLWLYGPSVWRTYPAAMTASNLTLPFMVSWPGTLARVAGVIAPPAVTLGVYAAGLGVLGWTARKPAVTRDPNAAIAWATAWTLVISPNTHPYDLTLLAPAIVLLGAVSPRARWFSAWLVVSWIGLLPPLRWILFVATIVIALSVTSRVRNCHAATVL